MDYSWRTPFIGLPEDLHGASSPHLGTKELANEVSRRKEVAIVIGRSRQQN
jgi:hypothetical protein